MLWGGVDWGWLGGVGKKLGGGLGVRRGREGGGGRDGVDGRDGGLAGWPWERGTGWGRFEACSSCVPSSSVSVNVSADAPSLLPDTRRTVL